MLKEISSIAAIQYFFHQPFLHPKATSSANINVKPHAKQMVPMLE